MVTGQYDKIAAECWFLDVGQGTCNVILLGEGRGIVIDCGPRSSNVPLKLLKRYVSVIEALIISHNDADHDGGAVKILQAYPKAVRNIYFLVDRPVESVKTYAIIKYEMKAGNLLNSPRRLEAGDKPQIIYQDQNAKLLLQLIYPTFIENLFALEQEKSAPNQTSGILVLICGNKSIVFSGDAMMPAWKAIAEKYGTDQLPLKCEVLTIPHHGGYVLRRKAHESKKDFDKRHEDALECLYNKIITPRMGIVSVGSSNRFNTVIHPLPETLRILTKCNVGILCTQMTPQCCKDLEKVRPGIVNPVWPSESRKFVQKTRAQRSKNVGCASSIVAKVSPDSVDVNIWKEYQQKIEEQVGTEGYKPLCRE